MNPPKEEALWATLNHIFSQAEQVIIKIFFCLLDYFHMLYSSIYFLFSLLYS